MYLLLFGINNWSCLLRSHVMDHTAVAVARSSPRAVSCRPPPPPAKTSVSYLCHPTNTIYAVQIIYIRVILYLPLDVETRKWTRSDPFVVPCPSNSVRSGSTILVVRLFDHGFTCPFLTIRKASHTFSNLTVLCLAHDSGCFFLLCAFNLFVALFLHQ